MRTWRCQLHMLTGTLLYACTSHKHHTRTHKPNTSSYHMVMMICCCCCSLAGSWVSECWMRMLTVCLRIPYARAVLTHSTNVIRKCACSLVVSTKVFYWCALVLKSSLFFCLRLAAAAIAVVFIAANVAAAAEQHNRVIAICNYARWQNRYGNACASSDT